MNRNFPIELTKVILYLQFNGVVKVIDYLQVLMIIFQEYGICKENFKVCSEPTALLFVLVGINQIVLLPQVETRLTFSFGTQIRFKENLYINLINLDKL
jgi:hypothetical protein